MKVFEFQFNPKGKEDLVFDSFCYEPENVYEKRLGSLFLVQEIKNALPQNQKFLENFSSFFKKEFYSSPIKFSPESALRHSLKSANEYLEKIVKNGDVSWLGNFSSVILNIKNFELNFTKVGTTKILLLRNGQLIDLGKNLEFQEIEPYPLKIFTSIVSGKAIEKDLILVFTQNIYNFFLDSNLLKEIAKIQIFDQKNFKNLIKTKEKELSKISGIFLLICLIKKESLLKEEKPAIFAFQPKTEKFSLKRLMSPAFKFLLRIKKIKFSFPKLKLFKKTEEKPKKIEKIKHLPIKKTRVPQLKINFFRNFLFKISHFKPPSFKLPSLNFITNFFLNKNVALVLALVFVIFLGNFIFQNQEKQKTEKIKEAIDEIEKSILDAQNYLKLNNSKKAYEIYKNIWQKTSDLTKEKNDLEEKLVSLRDLIEENLKKITKLENISDPKVFFEFDEKEFIPQKMIFFENDFYFFNPFDKKIIKINLKKEKTIIEANETFSEAGVLANSIAFFQKPNLIFLLKNDKLENSLSLVLPYSNFEAKSFCTFQENIYFLDSKNGEIIKYSFPLSENKDFPKLWLAKESQKVVNAKSMSVDGYIWLINRENKILQYYGGRLTNTLELELFPEPENFTVFQAKYGLFYILEPSQRRIIIADQNAKIIKQFQSDKFDNLKDFSVSSNGRTIWLLNGIKVFEVSF